MMSHFRPGIRRAKAERTTRKFNISGCTAEGRQVIAQISSLSYFDMKNATYNIPLIGVQYIQDLEIRRCVTNILEGRFK